MIEIGGKPIIWHILKIYSAHGINDFVICLGYKGYVVKEYFANYFLHSSDVTFDMENNRMEVHEKHADPWRVTLVDTGENTATGGRLKRVKRFIEGDEPFCFTYGDGVANVDIRRQVEFHRQHGLAATACAVTPPGRFGAMEISRGRVSSFREKPHGEGGMINGGFFVLNSGVLDLIDNDDQSWEGKPLHELTTSGQLAAWEHEGFWQPMDTLRDKMLLEDLWKGGNAPWKIW
jgi:glucose-1-phosphate cytidylyltransferase